MFHLHGPPILAPQVDLQRPPEQLEQDLEAGLGDGRVVAALAQLIADKGMLSPGKLVEAKDDAGVAQLGADEVAARVRDVRVLEAKEQRDLALEVGQEVDGVVAVGGGRGGGVGCGVGA